MKTRIKLSVPHSFWFVAILFLFVGTCFALAVPLILEKDEFLGGVVFTALATVCLSIGGVVFLMMIYSLWVKWKNPENLEAWLWWVNFVGGLIGALFFIVPSILIEPTFSYIGVEVDTVNALMFPIVGVAAAVMTFFIGRSQYRGRPLRKN